MTLVLIIHLMLAGAASTQTVYVTGLPDKKACKAELIVWRPVLQDADEVVNYEWDCVKAS